jgi:hypothetical protein
MDPVLRPIFNRHYGPDLYRQMCALMDERLATPRFEFRLAETPLLLPADLRQACVRVAREIQEILRRPEIIARGEAAVPERYRTPGRDALPHFNSIDLAIAQDEAGRLVPRLIELQGFSSLYGMQLVQSEIWGEVLAGIPEMPQRWTGLFSGLDHDGYLALLRRTVIADAAPEEVVLLDLDPASQKTRPDFHATAHLLGVRAVCATELKREGRRLLAPLDGRYVPVRRILHRIVFDELERKRTPLPFDYRDDLDVVWAAHPTWYWLWSRPRSPTWTTRRCRDTHPRRGKPLPDDLSRYILKPLFSFAGQGVRVDVDRAVVRPPRGRAGDWLLLEKVTLRAGADRARRLGVKAEIRMMFLRPDGEDEMTLAINLVRLSRGKMHGVDHNKGLELGGLVGGGVARVKWRWVRIVLLGIGAAGGDPARARGPQQPAGAGRGPGATAGPRGAAALLLRLPLQSDPLALVRLRGPGLVEGGERRPPGAPRAELHGVEPRQRPQARAGGGQGVGRGGGGEDAPAPVPAHASRSASFRGRPCRPAGVGGSQRLRSRRPLTKEGEDGIHSTFRRFSGALDALAGRSAGWEHRVRAQRGASVQFQARRSTSRWLRECVDH